MSQFQESIHVFAESLLPGRRLDVQAARSLLGCTLAAPGHASALADLPPGSTWGQIAAEVLNSLSRAA